MTEIRIAIIGIGNMGKKYAVMIHSGAIKGLKLTAISCRSDSNKQWVRETLSEDLPVFETAEHLYQNSNLFDAVLIATPHKEHPDLVIQAFAHGLHVFCDKPAGITSYDAKRMNLAATAAKKAYAMMFHKRTIPIYQAIKNILLNQELGQLIHVSFANTEYLRTQGYHQSSAWRSTWEGEGGGLLINQAQHPLDLWHWWFGAPNSLIADISFGKLNPFQVDDECTLLMQYESDMKGSFFVSTIEGAGEERIEISGTKGKLITSGDTLTQYMYRNSLNDFILTGENGALLDYSTSVMTFKKNPMPYETMLQNFTEHILYDVPLIAPGDEGLYPVELTNAAYLSAWKDQKIYLPFDNAEYDKALAIRVGKHNCCD